MMTLIPCATPADEAQPKWTTAALARYSGLFDQDSNTVPMVTQSVLLLLDIFAVREDIQEW
jgi:hypothetical protein